MNDYELVLIFAPDAEKASKELVETLTKAVEAVKGKVVKSDSWGKKLLAYPISKLNEGMYHYMEVSLPAEEAPRLERRVKTNESVIRYLMIRSQGFSNKAQENKKKKK